MPKNDFTVLLDKREGTEVEGVSVGDAILRGKPFYMPGSTGLADSIDAVVNAGLIHVPTFGLIAGRAYADKEEEAWQHWHDSKAERITALDEKGILGEKGVVYVIDIQNGGLFVWNTDRIREAVKGGSLVNGAIQLNQEEINPLLDAIKGKDYDRLKQIIHGIDVVFAGNYGEFVDASKAPDFLRGMNASYVVVRTAEEARKLGSGLKDISSQRKNPELIIPSGGEEALKRMLDRAQEFGWKQFGAWNDGYQRHNLGRVACLDDSNDGVYCGISLNASGRSVGVAPVALEVFYKKE